MFIEMKPEILTEYIIELHAHLFEGKRLDEVIQQVSENHRASHLVMLYAMKDKETFDYLYQNRDMFGIESLLNAVIAALLEDNGFDLPLTLCKRLGISASLLSAAPSEHDKSTVVKHLRSFVMYARKQDPNGFVPPLPTHLSERIKSQE